MKRLGKAPKEAKDPTRVEIDAVATTLRRKVEDMDRAGDVVATYAPVTLGPPEIRIASYVFDLYGVMSDNLVVELKRAIVEAGEGA